MNKYLLKVTHVSADPNDLVSTWYKPIERDWPSVPGHDQYVAFGGPDDLASFVTGVVYAEDHVRVEFMCSEPEEGVTQFELERLGFQRQDSQEPPAEWFT